MKVVFCMDKEKLFHRIKTSIISSTKEPKYVTLSTVKLADIFESSPNEIDQILQEFVQEGKLKKDTLPEPPKFEIYMLP